VADIFLGQDGKIREWNPDDFDDDYQRGRTAGIVEERERIQAWLDGKGLAELSESIGGEEHVG